MKKVITLLLLIITISTGIYAQRKDLTPPLNLEGALKVKYASYPKGTPLTVMNAIKLVNQPEDNGIYLAVSINNIQTAIPANKVRKIIEFYPKTMEQFWMSEYLKSNMFEHHDHKGYRSSLRRELTEESDEYLQGVSDLFYEDAYINDYIRNIFIGVVPRNFNKNRPEYANVKIIQSPDPYANMLANGTLLISTGLLSTLDSVEELTAIIVTGIAHHVLDHPVTNVANERSRIRRADFWGGFLVVVAGGVEIALSETHDKYIPGGVLLTAGIADAALNYSATQRLGMGYTDKQRKHADRIATDFLKFADMDPAALTSALTKIRKYYLHEQQHYSDQRSFGNLNLRISNLEGGEEFSNRMYQKTISDVTRTNAIIQLNSHNYEAAKKLAFKSIDNQLASDEDYVVLIKSDMQLSNTPESNEKCLELIQTARQISQIPNLELYKQEILLLMRLNKQQKANDRTKEYLTLLTDFKNQSSNHNDIEWAEEEIQWANKLYQQLGTF